MEYFFFRSEVFSFSLTGSRSQSEPDLLQAPERPSRRRKETDRGKRGNNIQTTESDESCAIMVDVEELVEESKPILPPALAAGTLVDAKAQPPPLVTSCAPTVTEPNKFGRRSLAEDSTRQEPRVQHSRYSSLVGENLNIIEQMQTNESLCK
jgi:hypothetical protein